MRRLLLAAAIVVASTVAIANVGTIQIVNNGVPSGGYLLDSGGAGSFVTPDVAGNKIFAR